MVRDPSIVSPSLTGMFIGGGHNKHGTGSRCTLPKQCRPLSPQRRWRCDRSSPTDTLRTTAPAGPRRFTDGEAGCGWSHRTGGGRGAPAAWLRAGRPAPRHCDRGAHSRGRLTIRSRRKPDRTVRRTASGMVFSARLGPPLVGSDPPGRLDTNAVWVDARQMMTTRTTATHRHKQAHKTHSASWLPHTLSWRTHNSGPRPPCTHGAKDTNKGTTTQQATGSNMREREI